jgi:hypothetical protein
VKTVRAELLAKRRQLTLDGLAEVDAGDIVDHAAVEAWAAMLRSRSRKKRR